MSRAIKPIKQQEFRIHLSQSDLDDMQREYDPSELHFFYRIPPDTKRISIVISAPMKEECKQPNELERGE